MWSNKNNVFWHVEWSVRIAYCHCRCPNTKTQLLRLCLSAACFVLCCVRVCVCLRLASHDLWKWFVTCGGPEDTTLNHIDCSSYYILLFPFFFFSSRDKTLSPTWRLRSPSCYCGASFLAASIWVGPHDVEEEERGRGRAVDFLWVWVWKHYLLFRGCCSEAAGWRALPAVPNRNWERDALIKKTPMKALSTHKHTHSLLPRVLWKPSLSLHLIHTPGWKHIILEVHRKRNCYITIINMCGCVLDLTYHEPCLGEGIHCKYKSEVQSSTVKGSTAAHEHMMWL